MIIPESELEFSYVRSSGPGGQNVNKVNSKVVLRWNLLTTGVIGPEARARFMERFGSKVNQLGEVILTSDRHRDQPRNREDCIEKLTAMLKEIQFPPKKRKKSKPSRSSQRKRVESKKRHSDKKSSRQRVR